MSLLGRKIDASAATSPPPRRCEKEQKEKYTTDIKKKEKKRKEITRRVVKGTSNRPTAAHTYQKYITNRNVCIASSDDIGSISIPRLSVGLRCTIRRPRSRLFCLFFFRLEMKNESPSSQFEIFKKI
jgi:hypothetical protein